MEDTYSIKYSLFFLVFVITQIGCNNKADDKQLVDSVSISKRNVIKSNEDQGYGSCEYAKKFISKYVKATFYKTATDFKECDEVDKGNYRVSFILEFGDTRDYVTYFVKFDPQSIEIVFSNGGRDIILLNQDVVETK